MDQPKDKNPLIDINIPDLEKFYKKYEIRRIHSTFVERVVLLLISASGFVAALAWDDALKTFFREAANLGNTLSTKFVYAAFVTLLAVGISILLGKIITDKKQ